MSKKILNKRSLKYLILGFVLLIILIILNDGLIPYTALNVFVYIIIGVIGILIAKYVEGKLKNDK